MKTTFCYDYTSIFMLYLSWHIWFPLSYKQLYEQEAKATKSKEVSNYTLCHYDGLPFTQHDYDTLAKGEWLNDVAVHFGVNRSFKDNSEAEGFVNFSAAKEGLADIKTTTGAVAESAANMKTKPDSCVCENCPVMEDPGHQKCCRQVLSWMEKYPSAGL